MSQSTVKSRADYDAEIAKVHLRGEWLYDDMMSKMKDGPQPAGIPYVWQWATMREKLEEAAVVIPQSFTARRTLNMMNPALPTPGTTHTVLASIQMVLPGEIAWAHRHDFNAIRFSIEGTDLLYTAVDGEKFPMEPGDLILNPTWTWHDHHNEGVDPGIWLDVLDVPLGFSLNQPFYEPYGQDVQPILSQPPGLPYRFAWRDAKEKLYALPATATSRSAGIEMEYVGPGSGKSVMPTLGCYLTLLRAGFNGLEQRLSTSAVYHVVQGSGSTIFEDREIHWSERDTFAVPNWTRHRHVSTSSDDVILFKVDDRPLIAAMGFLREERAPAQ